MILAISQHSLALQHPFSTNARESSASIIGRHNSELNAIFLAEETQQHINV